MKSIILNYLKSDRSFDAGLRLYMQYGNNVAFKTVLNRQGWSEYNHNLLLEELRKVAGISQLEFSQIMLQPVKTEKKSETTPAQEDAAGKEVTAEEKKAFIDEIPIEIRKTIKLRDEFPFLNKPDCPDELKILVSDRISAYHKFVEDHARLFAAVTDEEMAALSESVVKNYLENCEIWDELKAYKETGKILGLHPIFAEQERVREIKAMSTADLVKLQKNLISNISKNNKKIEADPESPETDNRMNRVKNYKFELTVVNGILGLGEKNA